MRTKKTAKVNRLYLEAVDVRALERAKDVLDNLRDAMHGTAVQRIATLADEAGGSIEKVLSAGTEFDLSGTDKPQLAVASK